MFWLTSCSLVWRQKLSASCSYSASVAAVIWNTSVSVSTRVKEPSRFYVKNSPYGRPRGTLPALVGHEHETRVLHLTCGSEHRGCPRLGQRPSGALLLALRHGRL